MATCSWKYFTCSRTQLCIDTVLAAGQSFRWKKNSSGEWLGVMAGLIWRLKQTEDRILYQVYGPENSSNATANSRTIFQRSGENNHHRVIDLKPVLEILELKKEAIPVKKYCNSEEQMAVKTEECDRMESITCGISKAHSENHHNVGCKRSKRNVKKASTAIQKKESRNDQTEYLPVETYLNNKHSHPKKMKIEGRFLEEEPKEELVSQTIGNNIKHIGDMVTEDNHYPLLHDYFQLDVDLDSLYRCWSSKDPHFEKVGGCFQGVRILRQDPTECLLSFVCSSNNHISRISSMVEKLCTHYGDHIASVDGIDYYTFPHLSALCGNNVEPHLRELGFGYRAKFIASIAKHVTQEKEENWLESLRGRSYSEAKAELLTLLGVGAKVADCVCLMSLDKPEALPVDTHVWQITLKSYMARLHSAKSLTDKLYNEIGDFYRNLWGSYAGWAQAVLFAADLRHNKERMDKKPDSVNNNKADHDAGKLLLKRDIKRKQDPKPAKVGKKN